MTDLVFRPTPALGPRSEAFKRGLGRIRQGLIDLLIGPDYSLYRRSLLAIGIISFAFHYSLSTLLRSLKEQTPLAYLGLVPIISVLLAAAMIRPGADEPPIHDRQVDYILGVPMLLAALSLLIFMPIHMSTLYWLYRVDLLALPIFAAGIVTILFGIRTLWRIRIAVAFLILAWPLPYTTMLLNMLSAFTSSTLGGLSFLLRHVGHLATAAPSQGQGVFIITHGGTSFPVSVVSACSGVNGVVGYLLISMAFLTVVYGGWVRKLLWLLFGLAMVWSSNVLRIFMILFAGHNFGRPFAIDILHPYLGLLVFNLVVLAMVLLMKPFGLRMKLGDRRATERLGRHVRHAVPKIWLAAAVVALFALVGYVANSSLRSYDLVVSSLGAPRLVSFSDNPSAPVGWQVQRTNVYTWATPYFGEDSTWYRFGYSYTGDPRATLQSDGQVISDVINTSDVSTFSTYGIEACYSFHGYHLYSIRTVDLGGGVTGNVLAYYNTPDRSDWTTVYWHWPVRTANGKTRYERVTLMLLNTQNTRFSVPPPQPSTIRSLGLSLQNVITGKSSPVAARFAETEEFLVAFAHALIQQQAVASGSAKPPVIAAPTAHSHPSNS
jgi:exosortase